MSNDNELKRLEGFVGKLLQSFQDLKEENGRLTLELQSREETITELREQLTANDIERNEIGNRVSGIIDQIEEWEINLGEEVFDTVLPNDASRQGSLFSAVESEAREEQVLEAEEDGSRLNDY